MQLPMAPFSLLSGLLGSTVFWSLYSVLFRLGLSSGPVRISRGGTKSFYCKSQVSLGLGDEVLNKDQEVYREVQVLNFAF